MFYNRQTKNVVVEYFFCQKQYSLLQIRGQKVVKFKASSRKNLK